MPNGNPVPHAPVLALGALGGVPPSQGVVIGGTIPYRPEALAERDENRANGLTRDPLVKCLMPGVPRATYLPFPFQITQGTEKIRVSHDIERISDLLALCTGRDRGRTERAHHLSTWTLQSPRPRKDGRRAHFRSEILFERTIVQLQRPSFESAPTFD